MKIIKCVLTIIAICFIYECSTPYQPKGMFGGYKSYKLENRDYKITFKGNQHTKAKTVFEYLLRRCAEVTIDEDCEYFVVYEDSSYVDEIVMDTGPDMMDKILAYQKRPDNYLHDKDSEFTSDPKADLSDQKTRLIRTYKYLNFEIETTNVVGVYKIHMFKEAMEGLEDYTYSASNILDKYHKK